MSLKTAWQQQPSGKGFIPGAHNREIKKAGLDLIQAGFFIDMVGTGSFELPTPAMSTQCSTPELRAQILLTTIIS